MKKLLILGMALILAVSLAGCGGGGDRIDTVIVQTFSDLNADGDIAFTPPSTFTFSQDIIPRPPSVFFGLDGTGTEFRAFLDFPLDGSVGGGVVPLGATIVSADIEVFVFNLSLASTVPTLIDLVPFPITHLTPTDFDSAPLATRTPFNFLPTDINNFVRIDVTPLMQEAQRQGLRNFQIRFLLDLVPGAAGLVEIEDGTDLTTAPILTVEYR
jgi:hypothetical protein